MFCSQLCDAVDKIDHLFLGWWLAERQVKAGGLNGRPEKLPDVDVPVAKYGEVKLLAMMCKKCAAQEKAAGGTPAGAPAISATFPEPG